MLLNFMHLIKQVIGFFYYSSLSLGHLGIIVSATYKAPFLIKTSLRIAYIFCLSEQGASS